MGKKIRRFGIGVALVVVIALAIGLVSYSETGVTCAVNGEGLTLPPDLSAIPQAVAEDATRLATELFGDYQEKCNNFISQLLTIYSEASDKDFVVIFNSGGWGYKPVEHYVGWCSILSGIESELADLGYTSLVLHHLRTEKSLVSCLDELGQMISGYTSKAKDLADRVGFITSHIPDLRVIITGESNGTIICDSMMNIVADNSQVYSIQTGPPFWCKNIMLDRTLVMTDNGITPDSYSQGDFWAMAWGNLKHWLGLSQPIDDFGTEPHYIGAPGHDYWWQYPEVYSQITNFLNENFGIN